jgi:hypothetical protein
VDELIITGSSKGKIESFKDEMKTNGGAAQAEP